MNHLNTANIVLYKNVLYAWCDLADSQGVIFRKKLLGINAQTGSVVWDPNTTHSADKATGGMTLLGNKLYITGSVNAINGVPANRRSVCYNLDNRQTTSWNPLNNISWGCNGCGPLTITSNKKNTVLISARIDNSIHSLIASDTLSGSIVWQRNFSNSSLPIITAEDTIGYCFIGYCCNIGEQIQRIKIQNGQTIKTISYPSNAFNQVEMDTTSYYIGSVQGMKLYGKHLYLYGIAQDGRTKRRAAVQIDTANFKVTNWKPFNEREINENSTGYSRSVYNLAEQNGKVFLMGDFKLIKLRYAPQLAIIDPNLGQLLWKPLINHSSVFLYNPMATAFEGDSLIWLAYGGNTFTAFDARTGFQKRNFVLSSSIQVKKIIPTTEKLFLQGNINFLNGLTVTSGFGVIDKQGNPFPWDPIFPVFSGQVNQIHQYGDLICVGGRFTTNQGGYNLAFISTQTGELTDWKPNILETEHIRNFTIQGNEIIIDRDLNYISPPKPANYGKINISTKKVVANYYYPDCEGSEEMISKEKYVFMDTYCGSSYGQNVVYLDQEYKKIETGKKLLGPLNFTLSGGPQTILTPEPEDIAMVGNSLFYGFNLNTGPDIPRPFLMSTTFPKNFFNNTVDYFPKKGGNAGRVTVNFYGYDILEGSKVRLLKLGQSPVIVPDSMLTFPESYRMQAIFNLRNRSIGDWDVEISYPMGDTIVIANGFKIEQAISADIHVQIVAPAQIRVSGQARVKVYISNRGDFDAYNVPVWLTYPTDATLKLQVYINTPTGSELQDTLTRIPITGDNGELLGYAGWLAIPKLGAGELIEIPLTIQSSGANTINIIAYTGLPLSEIQNIDENPLNIDNSRVATLLASERNQAVNNKPSLFIPALKCMQKIIDLALEGLGKINPIVGCITAVKDIYDGNSGQLDVTGSIATAIWSCTGGQISDKYKTLKTVAEIIDNMNFALNGGIVIPEALDACKELLPDPKKSGFAPIEQVNIASGDPNDKLGPVGANLERFVNGKDPFSYLIRFENFDTATASAQFVVLIDTLDKNKFDLSTFQIGYFNVADTTFYAPPGKKHFLIDWDMRPAQNIILRMEAKFNDMTGILKANYTSLDPVTMELTEDIYLGFLPPNQNAPQGEGGFAFSVEPKVDLPNRATITNKAYIYFDYNDVVPTPPWSNKLDKGIPSSQIQSLPAISRDTAFVLNWGGVDNQNESGIKLYDIFVSVNNHTYKPLLTSTILKTINFSGKRDSTYRFYSIAYDSVYNQEPVPATFDAEIKIQMDNNIISIKSGDWNNPATWSCNCVPSIHDNVMIKSGHNIKVTQAMGTQGCKNLSIENGAVFDAKGVFSADSKH